MTRHQAPIRYALVSVATAATLLLTACGGGASDDETPAASAGTPTPAASPEPGSPEPGSSEPGSSEPGSFEPGSSAAGAGAIGAVQEIAGPPVAPPPVTARPTASEPDIHQATATGLSSGGAQLSFDTTVHDFGDVFDVQKDLPAEFHFTNTGTATLEIVDLKADCGCTVPTLSKRRYEPGERGVINVLYSPKGIGATEKFINLVTNVGGRGIARIGIRSTNNRFLWTDPPNLQFQPAKLGVPHRAVVKVLSNDPNFVIDEVWATTGSVHLSGASDFLTARLLEGTSPPEMEIVLTDAAPWGSSFAIAHVRGRGTLPNGEEHEVRGRVMVKADLFNDLRADRTYYTLKLIPPGASFEQPVRIWRESGEPFKVLSAEILGSTMPGTRVEARPVTDGDVVGYDIILSGETGDYVGGVRGSVLLKTDVPGENEIELRFSGLVREPSK